MGGSGVNWWGGGRIQAGGGGRGCSGVKWWRGRGFKRKLVGGGGGGRRKLVEGVGWVQT